MVSTNKCSFCGENLSKGKGLMYVKNDGTILYFCSKKCVRNWEMGRNPKKKKWTKIYRELKTQQKA